MSEKILKRYVTPFPKGGAALFVTVIFIPVGFFGFYIMFVASDWFKKIENGELYGLEKYSSYFGIFVLFGGLLVLIKILLDLKQKIFSVNLTEDMIYCFNFYKNEKKKKIVRFENIREIRPAKRDWLSTWHCLQLVLDNGRKVTLWGGMNRYGDLIEEIRKRSPNLESFDYGGYDKNPDIWDDQRWDDNGKRLKKRN